VTVFEPTAEMAKMGAQAVSMILNEVVDACNRIGHYRYHNPSEPNEPTLLKTQLEFTFAIPHLVTRQQQFAHAAHDADYAVKFWTKIVSFN
jgi:hypothetical protein